MASWRPRWAAVCAACARTVPWRLTRWSTRHGGPICERCDADPVPTECDYDPAAVLATMKARQP